MNKKTKNLRLQKILADAGVSSRRMAETLISAGRVKVNGQVIKKQGVKVDPYHDTVELDNKAILIFIPKVYYLVNKPQGIICSANDEKGRKTIIDLVPKLPFRIFPVGRLDYNSEGLIILTNDGTLAQKLTHPSFQVQKIYRVKIQGTVTEQEILSIKKGFYLDGRMITPMWIKFLKKAHNTWLEICILEGKKHEIRRIFKMIGHPVMRLKRSSIGPINDPYLKPGHYRQLSDSEIKTLKSI